MAGIGLPEVAATLNSDLTTPLSHIMWLNDYNLFGERSYVFQNKKILHELYKDYKLVMNDSRIRQEVFDYVIEKGLHVGECLGALEGAEGTPEEWSVFDSIHKLISMSNILSYCENDVRIMDLIHANETASKAYITATDQAEVYTELISLTSLSTDEYPNIASILESDEGVAAIMTNESAITTCIEHEQIAPLVMNVYGGLLNAIAADINALYIYLHNVVAVNWLSSAVYKDAIIKSPLMLDIIAEQEVLSTASYDGLAILTGYTVNAAASTRDVSYIIAPEGMQAQTFTGGKVYAFARSGLRYTDVNGNETEIPGSGAGGASCPCHSIGTTSQPYVQEEVRDVFAVISSFEATAKTYTQSYSQNTVMYYGAASGNANHLIMAGSSTTATAAAGTVSYIPLPLAN